MNSLTPVLFRGLCCRLADCVPGMTITGRIFRCNHVISTHLGKKITDVQRRAATENARSSLENRFYFSSFVFLRGHADVCTRFWICGLLPARRCREIMQPVRGSVQFSIRMCRLGRTGCCLLRYHRCALDIDFEQTLPGLPTLAHYQGFCNVQWS